MTYESEGLWPIGARHPGYGTVQMMATTGGEAYRWLVKDRMVSMMPLSMLNGASAAGQVKPGADIET